MVLDFGIARLESAETELTRTGVILGTLRYMSPEQARGRVDQRSDIFSAGAVFYELLSLRRAFDTDDPIELLEMLRSEDPPPLTELDPAIPSDLAGLVARALRKHPAERFGSLGELQACSMPCGVRGNGGPHPPTRRSQAMLSSGGTGGG